MNVKPNPITKPQPRSETRELKTLTLRIPVDIHEQIERAAKTSAQSLNQFIADAAREAAKNVLGEGGHALTSLAILIDLDSFGGRPTINVDALERVALALGRPVIRCSFSTAGSIDLAPSRQTLLARHYRHEELPSRDALRLRLTVEAMDINTKGEIRDFIIVTGDEEFGFVSSLLTRQGAKVTGVGVRAAAETNPDFIRAFESFRYYDQIDRPPESEDLKRLRTQYAESLIQAVLKLESRGAKAVGAALIPMIKDQHPGASPELLEFRNWKELAEFAREQKLVQRIESSGVDFLVKLTDHGTARAHTRLVATEAASAQLGEIAGIRTAISEILGIELPDVSSRFLIFNAVQWVLNEEMDQDGISLVELSYRVAARLGPSGIQQNTIYRLLNGLYRCGAFDFVPNPASEYDPRILRARISVLHFDHAFVLNLMRVRRKFPALSNPKNLSTVIYGTPAQKEKVVSMLTLAGDSHFDRANLPGLLGKLGAVST